MNIEKVKEMLLASFDLVGDCWIWKYGKHEKERDNYGVVSIENKKYKVHRLSATIFNGFDIDSGICILHTCDNPPCYNPEHLFEGSREENNSDRDKKGRHGSSKVTHCPQGHEYNFSNTAYRKNGGRICRACNRDGLRARRKSNA